MYNSKRMKILELILTRLIDILLIFFIIYLAGILKRKFGKSLSDYFLQAASIAVKKTEQLSLTSERNITSLEKKEMALDSAKKILKRQNIKLKSEDEKILSDIIESQVYELNQAKKV